MYEECKLTVSTLTSFKAALKEFNKGQSRWTAAKQYSVSVAEKGLLPVPVIVFIAYNFVQGTDVKYSS